jgi:hypothetical protein
LKENANALIFQAYSQTKRENVLSVRLLSIGLRIKKNVLNVKINTEAESTLTINSKCANVLNNTLTKITKVNAENVKNLEFGIRNKRNVSALATLFGTQRNKSANAWFLTVLTNMETVKIV